MAFRFSSCRACLRSCSAGRSRNFLRPSLRHRFVGRAATSERGAASGLYLASYFFGGLVGSAVLGPIFDMFGWKPCVAGIAVALVIAALLAIFLKTPMAPGPMGRAGAH